MGFAGNAMIKRCELCGGEAVFHCAADSAFLCRPCDSKVHASNFLVARHVRRTLCRLCNSVTGNSITGSVSPALRGKSFRCKSCSSLLSSPSSCSFSSTLSSDCISSCELSSTDAAGEKKSIGSRRRLTATESRIHGEAKGIFVNWYEKLGLRGDSRNGIVSSASLAFERLRTTVLPYRVSLAAAFWFGVRVSEEMATWQNLKRVEEVSGVPSKLILAVELRLERALMRLRRRRWRWRVDSDMEEGWAESDGA